MVVIVASLMGDLGIAHVLCDYDGVRKGCLRRALWALERSWAVLFDIRKKLYNQNFTSHIHEPCTPSLDFLICQNTPYECQQMPTTGYIQRHISNAYTHPIPQTPQDAPLIKSTVIVFPPLHSLPNTISIGHAVHFSHPGPNTSKVVFNKFFPFPLIHDT